ncbi:MAG TPA: DinB family protein [bacterium]|nr:DinB family protein [bacterium]
MSPVHVYDVLLRARQKLFEWVRPLDQAQYAQPFPFGARSVRGCLVEIARAELFLAMRLREEPLPPLAEWPINEQRLPTFAELERVWTAQSQQTRATLAETTDWDRTVTCRLVRPNQTVLLTATKADIATQIMMHEVHHRAQAMAMLRQLGVEAQNLDHIRFTQTTVPQN